MDKFSNSRFEINHFVPLKFFLYSFFLYKSYYNIKTFHKFFHRFSSPTEIRNLLIFNASVISWNKEGGKVIDNFFRPTFFSYFPYLLSHCSITLITFNFRSIRSDPFFLSLPFFSPCFLSSLLHCNFSKLE